MASVGATPLLAQHLRARHVRDRRLLRGDQEWRLLHAPPTALAIAFSWRGHFLAVACADGRVLVFDVVGEPTLARSIRIRGAPAAAPFAACALAWAHNDSVLFVGYVDGVVVAVCPDAMRPLAFATYVPCFFCCVRAAAERVWGLLF